MPKGYLALVLHAHLPYVRHSERENYLEENWLFEALTETYIPLVKIFDTLLHESVDFRITVSLSPPLISMMSDKLLRQHYVRHLDKLIDLANKEKKRTERTKFEHVSLMYLQRLTEIKDVYVNKYNTDILQAFRKLRESGKVELITSCATHGYLPLMLKKQSMKAQVAVGIATFTKHFGDPPRGIWLPECAYCTDVDQILNDFGIKYFFTDTHGVMLATPSPINGVHAPLYTPAGVAAFGRDQETSRQVWDMNQGYPGDPNYREFYRDIGFDLDLDYIGPYIGENNLRIDTGFKYFRITGKTDQKQVYNPEVASQRAAEHAGNFMFNREKQIEQLSNDMDRPPIVVAPYDAELFGHWWYEGPQWIDYLLRKIHFDQDTVKTITPWEYLNMYPTNQVATLPESSWGHNGYNEIWLDKSNAWIYRHLHHAEERMVELVMAVTDSNGIRHRAMKQMARELLLAQSSDWAFIIKMGTSVEYAEKRTKDHVARFNYLYWAIKNNTLNENELQILEELDPVFPEIDYRIYKSDTSNVIPLSKVVMSIKQKLRVLMLSWEFPPKTVGGLARHVNDLSKQLALAGQEVHVITCHVPGTCAYEIVDGVHVHRVQPVHVDDWGFLEWVECLNMAMIECAHELLRTQKYDLIHAHDWLVAKAGIALKKAYKIPLISTIHATEYGRNRGIRNSIQRQINQTEWTLTYESWRVICCSKYMAREIAQVFQLPADKIRVIANGVEVKNIIPGLVDPDFRDKYAASNEKIVYFIGRLVPEKGVQVLIESVPSIIERYPHVKFIVSGVGYYHEYLKRLVNDLGIGDKVYFTGFADDYMRNMIFTGADIAVFPSLYEPFGIVALEAMAAHVPVIVSDTGGLGEVIENEKDGLTVYPDDRASLADAVVRLLNDSDFARRLSETAWNKVISIYNWGVIAEDTLEVYREVVKDASNRGYASNQ